MKRVRHGFRILDSLTLKFCLRTPRGKQFNDDSINDNKINILTLLMTFSERFLGVFHLN